MTTKSLLKKKRHKARLRIRGILPQSANMSITTSSPVDLLKLAYAISIYWDNDLDAFVADLGDFNGVQIHANTWAIAAAAAQITHQLLIESYRANGYTLPEV